MSTAIPKLEARHTSSGCFDISSTPAAPPAPEISGAMRPEMVQGSEPAQIHFAGSIRCHKRIDAETVDVRTITSTASTHRDLLDKFQRLVNAYYS